MTLSFTQKIEGNPTYFIEKIWNSLPMTVQLNEYKIFNLRHHDRFNSQFDKPYFNEAEGGDIDDMPITLLRPKKHTIRALRVAKNGEIADKQWKAGDSIHPAINNRSKNYFQFAPVIKCINVQNIEIKHRQYDVLKATNIYIDGRNISKEELLNLAINDGFVSVVDFLNYFNQDFKGVIIHWTDLKY